MKGSTRILLGALAIAALGLGVAGTLLSGPKLEAGSTASAPSPRAEAPAAARPGDLASAASADDRVAASAAAPDVAGIERPEASPEGSDRPDGPIHVRGRVVDVRGGPIPAVAVGVDTRATVLATSDASGVFELVLERGEQRLVSKAPEWITVRYDLVRASAADREHFVIVAPPIALGGTVVDAAGRPVEGATVAVGIDISTFARFPFALDSTGVLPASAKSGADGSFALERAPAVTPALLRTSASGFAEDARALPAESTFDLRIELGVAEPQGAVLEGRVVHEDGAPGAGATVHLAGREVPADEQGRFRLEIGSVDDEASLVATKPKFQPAVIPEYGRVIEATDGHPPPALLTLGPPPLAIAGRVLEADGRPCRKWTVSLAAGTAVSQGRIPVILAENVTSGRKTGGTTDERGAFEIGGLRDMTYVIQAYGADGRMIRSEPIPAGSRDVELRCDPDAFLERLAGRVVSREGVPLANVEVTVDLVTYEVSFGSLWESVKSARTGADGRFELERVPKRSTRLSVQGDEIVATSVPVEGIDPARPLEIAVVRLGRFRFEGPPGEDAPTSIRVLDAQGSSLSLVTREARSTSAGPTARLTDGSSHVLSVSEDAARLVLYRGDEVLSSQPLRLVPGEIVTVRRAR